MGLAGAGQSESQDVDTPLHEAALGQLVQLLPERQGHRVVLESLPGLALWELGLLSQPVDAPVPTVLGLLFQDFQEGGQGVAVTGGGEPGHRHWAPLVGSRKWWHIPPDSGAFPPRY